MQFWDLNQIVNVGMISARHTINRQSFKKVTCPFNGRPICPKNRLLANIAFSFAKCIINGDNISYDCFCNHIHDNFSINSYSILKLIIVNLQLKII